MSTTTPEVLKHVMKMLLKITLTADWLKHFFTCQYCVVASQLKMLFEDMLIVNFFISKINLVRMRCKGVLTHISVVGVGVLSIVR
jgi:hypothetical protein